VRLVISRIQVGDRLTMIGPDGQVSRPFTLADAPRITTTCVWLYRGDDAPIVVDRRYGIESTFLLHSRPSEQVH
jgi:hypothetical protein